VSLGNNIYIKSMENIVKSYPCGLRVIVRPMPNYKSVCTSVHVGVGSRNEERFEFGLAHVVEHMLFKGTKTRSCEQIAQTLSNLGVQYNAYTSNTATCFHTKGLLTNLDDCCDVLSDMYFNLQFSDDDFRREIEVIRQEIVQVDDNPKHALGDLTMENYFKGTKYEHPVQGTEKSVKSFKPQMVHDFIKKHYVAEKTILSFAGDITMEQVERVVKKYWLNRYKEYRAKPVVATFSGQVHEAAPTIAKRKKKIGQQNVAVVFPACNVVSSDKYVFAFIHGILSGDMSSRLFSSVREKLGLVYSIHGGFDLFDIGGYYFIWFSCTPKNTQKVLDTIAEEIEKMTAEGVTEEEMQRIRNNRRSHRLFEIEDVERTNQRNATQLWELGAIETAEQYLTKIDKVRAENVLEVAKKYLDLDKIQINVVGNPQSFHKMCKKVVKSG